MSLASPLTDALQGWGTAAGALVALAALAAAVVAYRAQNRQLALQQEQIRDQQELNRRQGEVLDLQAQELLESLTDRRDAAATRHRAQATFVFIAFGQESESTMAVTWRAKVENQSTLPIYDVVAHWTQDGKPFGSQPHRPTPRLMPRGDAQFTARADKDPPGSTRADLVSVATFRDAGGSRWRITAEGDLDEVM